MTRARNISNPQSVALPLTVSANITSNATIVVGNVNINTISYSVGNSTVNTTIHATSISTNGTLSVGNTTITGNVMVTGPQFVNGIITFANSTSNTVIFAANGNVGIGNAAPSTALSIKGLDAAISLQGTRGSGASHTIETSSTNDENLAIRASSALYLSTNGGDRIIAAANGNVGVGNTVPTHKLSVNGTLYTGGVSTFGGSLNPASNSSYDLGSSTGSWRRFYSDSYNNTCRLSGYWTHSMSYPTCYSHYYELSLGTLNGSRGQIEILVSGQHRSGGSCGETIIKRIILITGDLGIRMFREYSQGSDYVRTNFNAFGDTSYTYDASISGKTLKLISAPSNCGCDFSYWFTINANFECFSPLLNYSVSNVGGSNPSLGT
jgi:hypothetical protein